MLSGVDLASGPIASGRTADLYAAANGQVVKLLKPGFHPFMLEVEAAKTAAVHAAGVPAPGVGGRVEVDGRPGLLFERVDGATMLEEILSDLDNSDVFVAPFADLHIAVFNASAGDDLPDVKEYLADKIERADLPLAQRTRAKDHLVGLPDGAATLHGDYHPGNIVLADAGPVIIDWGEASRGVMAADIARTLLLLTPEAAADVAPDPGGVRAHVVRLAAAYKELCLRMAATTVAEVEAWRLPVMAARISEDVPEQTSLLQAEVARRTS